MGYPNDKARFRIGVLVAVSFVLLISFFAAIAGFYNENLRPFGIQPRTFEGLLGIFTSPIVHGDVTHLLANSIPLLLSVPALFYFHYKNATPALMMIYLLSGFWVWLSARDSVHLGASGIVYGLLCYLFFAGIFSRKRHGYAIAAAILFLYGVPVITGFIPTPGISYESHISGATAGLFMAVYNAVTVNRPLLDEVQVPDVLSSTADSEITFIYQYKSNSESQNRIVDDQK